MSASTPTSPSGAVAGEPAEPETAENDAATVPATPENRVRPSRIGEAFARAKAEGRTALIPFVTGGYPSLEMSERLIPALVRGGADLVEIGVPFSDPLADGKTVQRTSQAALANGTRLVDCVALAARVRSTGIETPLVLMGYYNPFLQYGLDRFAADAATAGIDGVIVPDLPAEEADDFAAACRQHGRDLIFLLAPTSTEARIAAVGQRASGFVYCVSLRGVTGARDRLPDLTEYLARVRRQTRLPLAVGFGVSTAAHVRQVGEAADGAVVASALIDHLDSIPVDEQPAAAEAFVRALHDDAGAIERNRSGASNERG